MMFVCLWFCLEERGKDQFWKSPILYFSFLKVRASFLPSFPPLNGISWKMRKLFCLHRLEEGFGKVCFVLSMEYLQFILFLKFIQLTYMFFF